MSHPAFKAAAAVLILAATLSGSPVMAQTPAAKATTKVAKPLVSKHETVSETVTMLERAKKSLQSDTSKDTATHNKANALADIEKAMQELRKITQGSKH